MAYEVEYTDQFEYWWETLSRGDQEQIDAAIEVLEEHGPSLGRPLVDTIDSSRHQNMKELRVGTIRVLFAFDPRRVAILLIGGDKREQWSRWYDEFIPVADDLFADHLADIDDS